MAIDLSTFSDGCFAVPCETQHSHSVYKHCNLSFKSYDKYCTQRSNTSQQMFKVLHLLTTAIVKAGRHTHTHTLLNSRIKRA